MEQLLLVNPKRRGKRRLPPRGPGGKFLKRGSARKTAKRRRRRSNPVSALAGANPVRRHRRRARSAAPSRRRRRSNPISTRGLLRSLTDPIMPAVTGAGGAILNDVAFRFLPLPDTFKAGYVGIGVRAVTAVGIGLLLGRVIGTRVAKDMTAGALTVLAYGAIRPLVAQAAPQLLGYYGAGAALNEMPTSLSGVGEYLSQPTPDSLSEYLSQPMPDYSGEY